MNNDPKAPVGDLATDGQPTMHRGATAQPLTTAGFTPGTLLGSRYRIVALLGRGGMGEVYRADDLRLGHPVALKFVSVRSEDRTAVERLYHEVRISRQVSHPNVCRVHDIVEADGLRFIAMEYVDGEDLASLLRRVGRLPPQKGLEVAREIAAGLAAAHDRGVIHRDLKPGNVMVDGQGRAHITDFGLASVGGEEGVIAGTAAYMAPEQVTGEAVTLRSDVYALGLIFHEIFTGERLYDSGSYADRRKHRYLPARRVSSIVRDVDPAVDAVIAACLAAEPAMRPASARVVLSMLPGGDPLEAALAAGETPSPEMVAAASETGELPLGVAAALCVVIPLALIGVAWQTQSFLFTLMKKPPEVFAERAAEIVSRAGETSASHDEVWLLSHDDRLLQGPGAHLGNDAIAAIRPGLLLFTWRRSPSRLTPHQTTEPGNDVFIFQSGRVTYSDPPVDEAGRATVTLDQHGGLVSYVADPSAPGSGPNWLPLLESTGIDLRTLQVAQPSEKPPVPSDSRVAWTAAYPQQRDRVRIEAASLQGSPAWLRVFGSWAPPAARRALPNAWSKIALLQLVIMIGFTIAAIWVMVRSMHRGRSDRRGAFRLALYLGACLFLAWMIGTHHADAAYDEARMFAQGVGQALSSALAVWIFYMALEPGVRRTWPRSLIGWTRLLSGRFRDPMVGREILLGLGLGLITHEMFWLTAAASHWFGRGASSYFVKEVSLAPTLQFIADQLLSHVESIEIPIGTIFIFLLGRRALGLVGATVAFLMMLGAYATVSVAIVLHMLLLLVVLLRSGLLTGVVMGCTLGLVASAPLTLDTSAWYWPRALAVMLIVTAAALWSARLAIGPRPLLIPATDR